MSTPASTSASPAAASAPRRATRDISIGLEVLLSERQEQTDSAAQDAPVGGPGQAPDFDILIIGSGYGGAAAAETLSRCVATEGQPDQALRIAVLERGQEYLPGAFPRRMADLPGHVRFATSGSSEVKGYRKALFDFRLGPDMCVALANGLGGGSLINAGVMEPALPSVFEGERWPQALRRDPGQMQAWYEQAGRALGSLDAQGQPNTIARLSGHRPRRADFLVQLGAEGAVPARQVPITVALEAAPRSAAGLPLERCIACGDCATGCNQGAKESLDTNLLRQAQAQGARLVTGATVRHLERSAGDEPVWIVHLSHTDEKLNAREPSDLQLRARHVVLAAGSLGSTEILMRSREQGLSLSDRLGEQFSGNGDVLALAVDAPDDLNALADEDQAPGQRGVGPTITGLIDVREAGGFVVEDLAIPGPMRWAFEESFAMAETLHGLARPDHSEHGSSLSFDDPYAIPVARRSSMLPVALMGLDAAIGRLQSPKDTTKQTPESGTLSVHWPEARKDPAVQARHDWLNLRLARQGARLLANPMWRLLPAEMSFLINDQLGPMLTVHPLGGCAMGDEASRGVVNEWGQVFSGRFGEAVHPGLAVLDGAIVPAAVGINPALTITALSLRALASLRQRWGLVERGPRMGQEIGQDLAPRPVYRVIKPEQAQLSKPTLAEFRERMGGYVRLPGAPGGELKYLELSFVFEPVALQDLLQPGPQRRLQSGPGSTSRLRLFDTAADPDSPGRPMIVSADPQRQGAKLWMHAEREDRDARWLAPLEQAQLQVFHRARSSHRQRRCSALKAWFMNRGWRDSMFALMDLAQQSEAAKPRMGARSSPLGDRVRNALALASHGGQVRLMEYQVRIQAPEQGQVLPAWLQPLYAQPLHGVKRISYTRRANPWTQLSRMVLEAPQLQGLDGGTPQMDLDLFYLARQGQPLLRITQQQDLASAMRDVGSLLSYVLRLLVGVHVWSFRKPDAAPPREPQRLPAEVPGLPAPEICELAVGRRGEAGLSRQPVQARKAKDDDQPVHLRLTRYRARAGGHGQPVLMLHGYSASGTTFAHHSVQPGPAQLLWDAGFDIWIADMRTSAGMPSACLPWTFEECALNDIPVAVDHVLRASGKPQIDVLAHCMGSVMLHMALLQPQAQPFEHFYPLRQKLMAGGLIRRLVISQVTPKMIFSPTNSLRAHLMQYIRPYLPMDDYSFRPSEPAGLRDQLIDRLLSSLPYPEAEFDIENPPFPSLRKTPWTATRHRMDLLYGRDFAIGNVGQPVFDFIDDHFGPLNMDTVAQAINFARSNEITDWSGASLYLDDMAKTLAHLQQFPVLSIHGQDNGLCQAESAELTADLYEQVAPGRYRFRVIAEHGHQDCLIGRHIEQRVFPHIIGFLKEGLS
ncbi:GMC family oxidoreductase N-terminal domain-containing protein [Paucibacter sp. DJ2R-2]|uniref:GMC family oxidoreductase N-terminal domain-containing protein n=1 Tax=Paucibacter sp. DJ2R-2 TaxID=2893558 RepID=UPI0021E47515|nr:GMC family oxidoreductase N-terminal domain-containing protein [Paucibacter sp. DJ2R-2]MCV2422293.1 GMC family oxidoreductase N-terminal domain-containing protein [Paucibacter sp. DJ4R-1]MCV2440123.1 GMC family oxidoreductase N-terminal domain-containing protein [Paucibacter sp. DJ2R-2]